jgi:hypothetical protein
VAVLARAATWLTAWGGGPVPYLSSSDPATWFHGYRRDCSGYASMALGLHGPGLTAAGLAARASPIPKADLRAGDLLINPAPDLAGHVVIFDHWTDATMTSYMGYEQSGDGGTHHRVIPYPYFGGYPMGPIDGACHSRLGIDSPANCQPAQSRTYEPPRAVQCEPGNDDCLLWAGVVLGSLVKSRVEAAWWHQSRQSSGVHAYSPTRVW